MALDGGWQEWIVPDRPGLRQFALGAFALLLPVPALALGLERMIPAMVVAVVLGVGLGLGWALVYGRTWFTQAPVIALGIFAMTLGCTLHLALLPRVDVLLRVRAAKNDLIAFLQQPPDALAQAVRSNVLPTYPAGDATHAIAVIIHPDAPRRNLAFTPAPFRRWTFSGFHDSCYLLVRGDGTAKVYPNRAEFDAAVAEAK